MPSIIEAVKPTAPNRTGPGVLGLVGGIAVEITRESASIVPCCSRVYLNRSRNV